MFSFRSAQHRWDPKNQRPELWRLYNTRKHKGESIRVFPLSNWTELDVWQYIYLEKIPIVPLYYSQVRPVVERDGALIMVDDDRMPLRPGEEPMMRKVRFRTLGCYPLTGAIESPADTLAEIIAEMMTARTSEREGRVIDHDAPVVDGASRSRRATSDVGRSDRPIWPPSTRPSARTCTRACSGSTPAAASTTARARSSAACSSSRRRCSTISSRRWRPTRSGWARGPGELDFALLLDGLSAEREQGITIDVAYRFFSTEKRNFIVADTPGHEQYTRNMVTGASTADLSVILIDARKGVLTQTRRHSFLVSLLGIRHVVLVVNKMDLVDYSQAVFARDRGGVSRSSPPSSGCRPSPASRSRR